MEVFKRRMITTEGGIHKKQNLDPCLDFEKKGGRKEKNSNGQGKWILHAIVKGGTALSQGTRSCLRRALIGEKPKELKNKNSRRNWRGF